MIRWLLLLALFCTSLVALWVLVVPRLAEKVVSGILKDQGIELKSFELAGVSPWFARVDSIKVVKDGLTLSIASVEVDYLPWELAKGRLHTARISGLEVLADLDALENTLFAQKADTDLQTSSPAVQLPILPIKKVLVGETILTLKRQDEVLRLPLSLDFSQNAEGGISLLARGDARPDLGLSLDVGLDRELSGEITIALEVGEGFPAKALAGRFWPKEADSLSQPLPNIEADFLLELEKGKLKQTASALALKGNPVRWQGVLPNAGSNDQFQAVLADLQGFLKAAFVEDKLTYEVGGTGGLAVQHGENVLQAGTLGLGLKTDGSAWLGMPGARFTQADKVDAYFALSASTDNAFAPLQASHAANAQFGQLSLAGVRFKPFGIELRGKVDSLEASVSALVSESFPQVRTDAMSLTVKGLPKVAEVELKAPVFWKPMPAPQAKEIGIQLHLQARLPLDSLKSDAPLSLTNLPRGLQVYSRFSNREPNISLPFGDNLIALSGGINAEATLRDGLFLAGADWAFTEANLTQKGAPFLSATEVTGMLELEPTTLDSLAASLSALPKDWPAQLAWARRMVRNARAEGTGIEQDGGVRLGAWSVALEPKNPQADKRAIAFTTDSVRWQRYTAERVEAYVETDSNGVNGEVNGLFGDYQLPWAAEFSLAKSNTGSFALGVGPMELNAGRIFLGLIDNLSDLELTGNFSLGAQGIFKLADAKSPLSWSGAAGLACSDGKLYFAKHKLTVEGIECVVELESLLPLKSKGIRTLTFRRMASGDLQMSDGVVEFSIEETGELVVHKAEFTWLGGRILVAPFKTSLTAPAFTLAFACVGIDLVEMSALFPQTNTRAAGLIDGTLGIKFANGEVELLPGRFELRQGTKGKIIYDKRGWLTAGMPKEGVNYLTMVSVESAVENLDVSRLEITISPVAGQQMVPIKFLIVGQGWGEGLKTVVPIGGLTINAMVDFYEILDMPVLRQIEGMSVR